MIICLCHGLNSQTLEGYTQEGCNNVRKLQHRCRAGTTCGACLPELKKFCGSMESAQIHPETAMG